MATYGLTEDGFVLKRLQQIRTDINAGFISVFGDVDTDDDSVLGQISGVVSEPIAELWELMQAVYYSQAPASAEGTQLDSVVSYLGLERLGATATSVDVVMYTENPSAVPISIPAGTQVSIETTGSAFTLNSDTDINDTAAVDTTLYISDSTSGAVFTATINGTDYDATATGDSTNNAANSLYQAMTSSSVIVPTDYGNGHIRVLSYDNVTPYQISVAATDGTIAITELGSLGEFTCTTDGTVAAPANTVTTIDTAIGDLDSVNNLDAGVMGRVAETDAELRIRRDNSLQVTGAGTVDSIRARIIDNVDNVSTASVWENTTGTENVAGIPAHSIYCVVSGGDSSAVAQEIWESKPAGIGTYGNVTVQVDDTVGQPHAISFSRPDSKYAWVDLEYQVYDEESYPGESVAAAAIKDEIKSWGDEYTVGQDIIRDRVYKPIYSTSVGGIGNINSLRVALMDDSTTVPGGADWTTGDISVDVDEQVVWSTTRMYVREA